MEPKEEIRRRIDVAELIGEYLNLKPAGNGSFKSPCPFHQDKDPSFYVSQDKQIWHCFGCDMGGDIFAFVMEIEGVDFPEALRILGKKAGVEITRFVSSDSNERQRMIAMHELAVRFYRKVLVDSTQAANARAYLENRGINKELADKFQLGYAPEAWDTLVNFMSKRGYATTEIEKAGLAQRKKSGIGSIDKFRNRIMIPLSDHHSNVVGFTGRIMKSDGEDHGPKYMNSPETLIYKKSELLYGLNLAKSAIKQSGSVIIVEGNLDVIASHKAGVENVVASSGTALTEQQISLLKRYTNTIIFSFDQDAAGFAAARRGIHLAQSLEMKVKVIVLSSEHGKDPDDVIQKDPQLWLDAVANPVPIMDFYFKRVVEGKDLNNVEDKQSTGKFLIEEIAMIADKIAQEHWLQKLSDLIKTEVNILRGMVAK
ncbi:MAG: DNA primase, partial [Candidatus Uhrbacteria bacterium]